MFLFPSLILVVAAGVGSAHPENFVKHMKQGLVSVLKVGWGGLSPLGGKFLAAAVIDWFDMFICVE